MCGTVVLRVGIKVYGCRELYPHFSIRLMACTGILRRKRRRRKRRRKRKSRRRKRRRKRIRRRKRSRRRRSRKRRRG
jgi:hypothetical protein